MHRLDNGQPLRSAITTAGLSIAQVADATRHADPDGKGISKSAVGNLVATGTSARETCTARSARLIAAVLGHDVADFFAETTQS